MGYLLIDNITVVNEGVEQRESVVLCDKVIYGIYPPHEAPQIDYHTIIDGTGRYLLPGVIDEHVHFREPGLTHKATIFSESRAAVAGGVTTIFDMPNCIPQTTTIEALEQKFSIAQRDCATNYSFYIGATNANLSIIANLPPNLICGVKLFMGSSTGNMLVRDDKTIKELFRHSTIPVVAHCEDSNIIEANIRALADSTEAEPSVAFHPHIRSSEACYRSTARAIELALGTSVRLHILHISTAQELELFSADNSQITAEACIAHLCFHTDHYQSLGTKIKCNPAIKSLSDRQALRQAVRDGRIYTVATDHAPHLLSDKGGGALTAASGMPILPYSLSYMLELHSQGVIALTDIARVMSHNPSRLFAIKDRGFIREGYKADLVIVGKESTESANSQYNSCGWNPFEGRKFSWRIYTTFVNGSIAYQDDRLQNCNAAERVEFDRE